MKNPTQKAIREKLAALPDWQKPRAYLRSTEHYDVSAEGETKKDWVEETAEGLGYEPYIVSINVGGGYTGVSVVVLAGHPDEALQTADEWTQTRYYDGDPDKYEEARGAGEGPVSIMSLMRGENPKKRDMKPRDKNPKTPKLQWDWEWPLMGSHVPSNKHWSAWAELWGIGGLLHLFPTHDGWKVYWETTDRHIRRLEGEGYATIGRAKTAAEGKKMAAKWFKKATTPRVKKSWENPKTNGAVTEKTAKNPSKKIPGISQWDTYAGGISALPGTYGYGLTTDLGNYKIGAPTRRGEGYSVRFENVLGLVAGVGLHSWLDEKGEGHGQPVFGARSPQSAAVWARRHYQQQKLRKKNPIKNPKKKKRAKCTCEVNPASCSLHENPRKSLGSKMPKLTKKNPNPFSGKEKPVVLIFSTKEKALAFKKSISRDIRGKTSVRKTKGWNTFSLIFQPWSYADTVELMKLYKPEKAHFKDISREVRSKNPKEPSVRSMSLKERESAKFQMRRKKGDRGPGGYKFGQNFKYRGKNWLVYDFDAEGDGFTLTLVSPDFKRITQGVAVRKNPEKNPEKNPTPEKNPATETRELELFIDNDGDLYRQRTVPIQKNLVKNKFSSKLRGKENPEKPNPKQNPAREVWILWKGKKYRIVLEETGVGASGKVVGGVGFYQDGRHIGSAVWTGMSFDGGRDVPKRVRELGEHWLYRMQKKGQVLIQLALDDKGNVKKQAVGDMNLAELKREVKRRRNSNPSFHQVQVELAKDYLRHVGGFSKYLISTMSNDEILDAARRLRPPFPEATEWKEIRVVVEMLNKLGAHDYKTSVKASDLKTALGRKLKRYYVRQASTVGLVDEYGSGTPETRRYAVSKEGRRTLDAWGIKKNPGTKKSNPKKKVVLQIPNPGGKMTKKQFEAYFKTEVMPVVVSQYGPNDKPARRESWNNVVDAMMRAKLLPQSAGDWAHPRWLETYQPRRGNPKKKKAIDAMAWSADPLVRDIASEVDDRPVDEIAESIMEVYDERSFQEPKATKNLTKDEAVRASTLASHLVDWANYGTAYNDYSSPPWERSGNPKKRKVKRKVKKVKRKVKKKVKRKVKKKVKRKKVRRKAPARRVTKTISSKSVTVTQNPNRAISAWMRL